jgi:putative ABC transport system permease protein
MHHLRQDLLYGVRSLRRSPGFAAAVIITLALGIGANSAVFSLVYAALLRPLPFAQASELAFVSTGKVTESVFNTGVSGAEFEEWKPQLARIFVDYATVSGNRETTWTAGDESVHLAYRETSQNFFGLLGVRPAAGRTFTADDMTPGRGGVVVLSNDFWRRHFAGLGEPVRALGQTLRQKGGAYAAYTVIGVLPPSFEFDEPTAVWMPQAALPQYLAAMRMLRRTRVVGRLRPGVPLSQAQAALDTLAAQEALSHSESNRGWGIRIDSLKNRFQAKRQIGLVLLWAAVGCLLWIACVNCANLLLSRAEGRGREIALRLALGATRGRLVAQLLTESGLLAIVAGGLGWALAVAALSLLRYWGSVVLPAPALRDVMRLHAEALNPAIVTFTVIVSALSVAAFGLIPARRATRLDLHASLQGGAGGRATQSTVLSQMLVTVEVAVVMILAVSAGLLIRSVVKLTGVDPGFRTENRLTFDIELSRASESAAVSQAESHRRFQQQMLWFEELERRLRSIPGVRAVGASSAFPISDEGGGWGVKIGDVQLPASTSMAFVTPGYFDAVEAPIVRGSNFTAADFAHPESKALIVNETMARLLFPGGDAVGRHVNAPRCGAAITEIRPADCVVVGIAKDTRFSLDTPAPPTLYYALRQDIGDRLTFVIYANGDPMPLVPVVRGAVGGMPAINGGAAYLFHLQTLDRLVAQSVATPRFRGWLVGLFAAIALLLASVGIYGVQAYAVTRRTREIGIRIALGARPAAVFRMVLGTAAAWTLIGIAIGLGAGLAATRVISGFLFDTRPTDPVTLAMAAAVVLTVALAAAWYPARRAMRVDPMTALRAE